MFGKITQNSEPWTLDPGPWTLDPEPCTLDRTEVAISKCSVAKLKAEVSHLNARLKEQRDVQKARLEELERHYDTQVYTGTQHQRLVDS
jgi:hypothetical protein